MGSGKSQEGHPSQRDHSHWFLVGRVQVTDWLADSLRGNMTGSASLLWKVAYRARRPQGLV